MSTTVTGKLRLEIALWERINSGLKAGVIPSQILHDLDLANGTADGKIDLGYYRQETGKAASGTTTYDLAGSLANTEGTTITFAEVCCVFLYNRRETALAWLQIGPGDTNGFGGISSNKGFWAGTTPRSVVGPQSFVCLYDRVGVPVGAGATDTIDIDTSAVSGDTNAWDLIILGRSA